MEEVVGIAVVGVAEVGRFGSAGAIFGPKFLLTQPAVYSGILVFQPRFSDAAIYRDIFKVNILPASPLALLNIFDAPTLW